MIKTCSFTVNFFITLFLCFGLFTAAGSISAEEGELKNAPETDVSRQMSGDDSCTGISCSENLYNCSDFSTHNEAQHVYECCGGVGNDVHALDANDDGVSCESLIEEDAEGTKTQENTDTQEDTELETHTEEEPPSNEEQIDKTPTNTEITISTSQTEVETRWDTQRDTWFSSNDYTTVSWTLSSAISDQYALYFQDSQNGGEDWGFLFGGPVNQTGNAKVAFTGLGCIQVRAYIGTRTPEEVVPVSDYSNVLDICINDPSLDLAFPDVPDDSTESPYTFYEQILSLSQDDIVSGYEDGYFRPAYSVTRAQMAKFIRRAYFASESDTSCGAFPDVSSDNPFYTEVTTLKCKGVIGGYEDGTFLPDALVTRAEAMKFVMFGLREREGDMGYLAYTGSEERFNDVPTDNGFYEVIMAAAENGIVGGYEDGTFQPDDKTSRGAMSKMVDNARKM